MNNTEWRVRMGVHKPRHYQAVCAVDYAIAALGNLRADLANG